jgi:hypothetical protein
VGIHGYVLVYSIASRESLDNCRVIRDKILDATGTNWVPLVLVGNKCDLEQQRYVGDALPAPAHPMPKHRALRSQASGGRCRAAAGGRVEVCLPRGLSQDQPQYQSVLPPPPVHIHPPAH